MKTNDTLDLSKDLGPGCEKCGASVRSMFYEMMEDDSEGHICKPKSKTRITIGDILLVIFFIGISFMLVVSFILLGAYLRTVF